MIHMERGKKHPEKPKPLVDQPLLYEGTNIDEVLAAPAYASVTSLEKKRAKVDLIALRAALREHGIANNEINEVFSQRLNMLTVAGINQQFAAVQTINTVVPSLARGKKTSNKFWERYNSLRVAVAEGATSLPERDQDLWSSKEHFMKKVDAVLEVKKSEGLITPDEVKLYKQIAQRVWQRDQTWKRFARIPYTDAFFSPGLSTFWPNPKEGSHAVRVADLALWLMDEKPFWETRRMKNMGKLSDLEYEGQEADRNAKIAELENKERERRRTAAKERSGRIRAILGKVSRTSGSGEPTKTMRPEHPPRTPKQGETSGTTGDSLEHKRLEELRKRLGLPES